MYSLLVCRCVWPLWSSLHVIFSNPENELAGKAKERHVRKMLLACLLAKQCLCIEDVRHVTRNQPRISKKRHKKKQQRREKFLHVGGNLCALLLTWPLDRHCAIIRRDCSAKRKRKKERECAKEAERSLIYGSEPTHTHTSFPLPRSPSRCDSKEREWERKRQRKETVMVVF